MRSGGRQLPYDNYQEIDAVSNRHTGVISLFSDVTSTLTFS